MARSGKNCLNPITLPADKYGAMTCIHPTAHVDPSARLGSNVSIGPFCLVEAGVQVGDGCQLASHVVLKAGSRLGTGNRLFEGVVVGGVPQHRNPQSETGGVQIGCGNVLREHVTVHRALHAGDKTSIGDGNLLMIGVHVAHDCTIADRTIVANNVLLAGHVHVGENAYLSGAVAVHQFCRIGRHAMVGGQAHITRDVPPFVTVDGQSSRIVGINAIGLRRSGASRDELSALKAAYRVIYRSELSWNEILGELASKHADGMASDFHAFLIGCRRGIMPERTRSRQRATIKLTGRPAEADGDWRSDSHHPERRAA